MTATVQRPIYTAGTEGDNARPYLIVSDPSAGGKQSCSRSGSDEFPITTLSFEHNFWVAVSWLAACSSSQVFQETHLSTKESSSVLVQVLPCFCLWMVKNASQLWNEYKEFWGLGEINVLLSLYLLKWLCCWTNGMTTLSGMGHGLIPTASDVILTAMSKCTLNFC